MYICPNCYNEYTKSTVCCNVLVQSVEVDLVDVITNQGTTTFFTTYEELREEYSKDG